EVEEHSGLLELVVVPAHRGEEFLAGHCARFRIPLDHQHHPHVLLPSRLSRATDGLDRVCTLTRECVGRGQGEPSMSMPSAMGKHDMRPDATASKACSTGQVESTHSAGGR